jgi:uncharacterized membrane protein
MTQLLTYIGYFIHIGGGFVGLISGTVALLARKGGRLHRAAGNGFFVAMSLMAVFAVYLAVVIPGQFVNVFIGVFALYLVGTAWLTVRRQEGAIGVPERIALLVAVCLCAPFVILAFQLTVGLPPLINSAVPLKGPVLIALYSFTTVLLIAAIADAKLVVAGGISGAPRIARHLWRMCLGLTLAAGSGFTNGFARLLPGPYHVPPVFFLPQFVPVLFLIFWMIHVRLTGWFPRDASAKWVPGGAARGVGN